MSVPFHAREVVEWTGGELLHGFLADLHKAKNHAAKDYINEMCIKWNVHYREKKD